MVSFKNVFPLFVFSHLQTFWLSPFSLHQTIFFSPHMLHWMYDIKFIFIISLHILVFLGSVALLDAMLNNTFIILKDMSQKYFSILPQRNT